MIFDDASASAPGPEPRATFASVMDQVDASESMEVIGFQVASAMRDQSYYPRQLRWGARSLALQS